MIQMPFDSIFDDIDLSGPIDPITGPVSRWIILAGLSGTKRLIDITGRNPVILTNGPVFTDANGRPLGVGSLKFDGVDDYCIPSNPTPPSLSLNGPMTVAAWVNTRTITGGETGVVVADCDASGTLNQYSIDLNRTPAKFTWLHGNNVIATSSTAIVTNRWYHIAATRSGSSNAWTVTFFLNGIADGSATTATNPTVAQQGFSIGALAYIPVFFFKGWMDDIQIFNRALAPDAIKRIYNSGDLNRVSSLRTFMMGTAGAVAWNPSLLRYNDKSLRTSTGRKTTPLLRR